MKSIATIWNNISAIGTTKLSEEMKVRNLILTNRIVIVTFILLLIYFFFSFNQTGWTLFNKSLLFGNFGALTVILTLNHIGQSILSRVILSLMFSVYPFYTNLMVKVGDMGSIEEASYFAPRLFIMITSIIPIVIFNLKEKFGIILGLLASFIPIVFFDVIHNLLNVGYYQMGFNASTYPEFTVVAIISYFIFLGATLFFKKENEKYEMRNLKLIASLEEKNQELMGKNREIENQSEKLEAANREIQLINKNLEQAVTKRTQKLLDQSNQFQKFAFKNSHELRAPLTNVMGIIDLLRRVESEAELKPLLDMLDVTSKDLDKVVHDINELISEVGEEMSKKDLT